MKAKIFNQTHVEGYIYEHDLKFKVSGPNAKTPGVEFINGTLSVATDDQLLNVIQVHFTYVTATTAKGNPNATYNILKSIIDGKIGSVMQHGKENAGKVRIDSAIALNEWYNMRDQEKPLISQKRNEGGFVHQTNELCDPSVRATFDTDIVITEVNRIEANEERNTPERVNIKGYIFNFRGDVLPIEFSVTNPKAMDYFEGLEASGKNPVFTRVKGNQVSQTIVRRIEEEGAWGDISVRETKSSYKDFVINWAQSEPYAWDDESTLLASELMEKLSQRELYLADKKRQDEEYNANRNNAIPTVTKKENDYDF